tara:strand:+ start:1846 stop:3144 length:1299 start_codon:yes stop_codon:yes gene_type:complete
MIRILDTKSRNFQNKFEYYLNLRRKYSDSKTKTVKKIVKDVRKGRDKSLIKYEKKFNSLKKLSKNKFFFSNSEIKKNIKNLDPRVKNSIDLAFSRIINFHKKQKFKGFKIKDKYDNILSYRSKAIDKIGVYVPGGKASYPSSVLMNCIPAMIAGVREIFMTVPALNNKANPGILYAARKCKVKRIFKLGGAQAIAAFAFGTETVTKVDKIVGPGNEYVSLAKKEVSGETGIDMFAGPSEVTIIADKYSNPEWISADLIAQSEHDEMSQSILVTDSKDIIFKVKNFLKIQLKFLPKRKIALSSLGKFGLAILARNSREISKIVNKISPEHLEVCTKKPDIYLKSINNVGSVFLGAYSPEAVGDYLAGPNHVLPTSGTAKFSSGLSVYDFLKRQSVIRITKRGIERLGPSVITLSKYENLHGHANSIKTRIKKR